MGNLGRYAVITALGAGLAILAWRIAAPPSDALIVAVNVPRLSALASIGEAVFEANCAECHGTNGEVLILLENLAGVHPR